VANRALLLSADVEPSNGHGVIVAQGGPAHGYTLYLQDGKPAFAVRIARQLAIVAATTSLTGSRCKLEAQLAPDGRLTISVDGKLVAEGRAPGLIAAQPGRGLTVGRDDGGVGDYTGPNPFNGKIASVTLRFP
jgi:hypothetical protein